MGHYLTALTLDNAAARDVGGGLASTTGAGSNAGVHPVSKSTPLSVLTSKLPWARMWAHVIGNKQLQHGMVWDVNHS